ncbi:hypothetical protein CHLNCDRAFT_143557 [Chlorella variabilis]|uniref:MaoC-like domain-containing protein n=1 Tax=Chlorella variabilis TaxID=554065 RepID=E1ZB62_CHLVA|nr:hypothetical protein CHLNCDRAFT_143557 [Chlorella variabilis]EFN57173.1 hypothetical protein CHLNCDRAFT_143557 [Chlorella variabilis]|eukprot:XP_005849275.1 hypothetical protein CHLNCDRAFT_143557 [Chlorella variabilis]
MTTVGRRAAGRLFALLHAKSSSVGAAPWCLTGRSLAGLASAGGGTSSGSRSPVGTDRLAPGAVFTLTKRFSPEDVAGFVALTGDSNPIHVDGGAAAAAGLPGPILPGMLLASLFPAIIGSHFPGAVYLSQTLKFKQYALVGDSFTASLTVEKSSGSRVSFGTVCRHDSTGTVVVEGTALALIQQRYSGGSASGQD